MDREYSVLNHPKQAIVGTHYLFRAILWNFQCSASLQYLNQRLH